MNKVSELADKYRLEGNRTFAFFEQIRPEEWAQIIYSDGNQWRVRDVLAHIVDIEAKLGLLVDNIVGGGNGITIEYDVDEFNAKGIAARNHQSPQDLIIEFQIQRKNMIDTISSLSEADLEIVGRTAVLGEISLFKIIRMFYVHVKVHIRDIRKVLG